MTKQTEAPARSALKLALEALNSFPAKHLTPFISSARTAIREALAEPSEALAEESSGNEQPADSEAYWQKKIAIAYAEGWLKGQVRVKQQPAQQKEQNK